MRYFTEIETEDYGLSSTGSDYAKVFTTYTNMYDENIYNDNQIIFKVIHLSSLCGSRKPKEFSMTFARDTNDVITFRDLTPEEKNISVVYKVDANGVVDVYVKGSVSGAKVKIQVLYCTNIAMYKFYNNAIFNNTPSAPVSPTNYDDVYGGKTALTLQNGWTKDTYFDSYYNKKGRSVWVNLIVYNGTYTNDTVIATIPYAPESDIFIPCVCYDGSNNVVAGLLRLLANGQIRVVKLPNNNTVSACFSYPTLA